MRQYIVLTSGQADPIFFLSDWKNPAATAACDDAAATARLHAQLTQELQAQVKGQLAHYEYPKEIEFVAELPMTTTGKVQRRLLRLQEEERYANSQS